MAGLAGLLSACSYVPTTSLRYTPLAAPAPPPKPPTLSVVPLQDLRPPRAYPAEFGHLFLTYIPLIPYVTIPYERLDESLQITQRERHEPVPDGELFPDKMAANIARDLAGSGLFSDVQFLPAGIAPPPTDYVLRGSLRSTEFDVNATSYMLGMAGVLLWLAPLPIGSNTADVTIDLELVARGGDVVWRHTLRGDARKIYTLYNSNGAPVSNSMSLEITKYGDNDQGIDPHSLWAYHAEALRSGMGETKRSLGAYLASAPPPAAPAPAQ